MTDSRVHISATVRPRRALRLAHIRSIFNMPVIPWDQRKRRLNLKKHGVDFLEG
jgi:hypothetical protein